MEDSRFVDIVIRLIKLQDYCSSCHYCEKCPFKLNNECMFVNSEGNGLKPYLWDIRELLYKYVGGKEE